MSRFKKENCNSQIRATIKDQFGRTITLYGTHAFDWSICVEGITGNLTISRFPSGSDARKIFNKLKRKK